MDSAYSVSSFVAQIGMETSGRFEDVESIGGDGTTEMLGLRTTPPAARSDTTAIVRATPKITTLPKITELAQVYMALPEQFRGPSTYWYTNSGFIGHLWGMTSSGGDRGLIPVGAGAGEFALLGRPLVPFDGTGWQAHGTADNEVGAVGDFDEYVLLERMGKIFERDDSVGFETDEVAFKMRQRHDSFFMIANAFRIILSKG